VARPATISFVTGPGIVKAREPPVLEEREPHLVRAADARWRRLLEDADLITEGAPREEAAGRFWYGSTSILLPADPADTARLAGVATRDLHVRLRALRTARREACLRAPGRLGRLVCEIRVRTDPRGVRIDVDVQAPLIERRAAPRSAR
jgi:hypothetical protein